jgi:hypothetical protein
MGVQESDGRAVAPNQQDNTHCSKERRIMNSVQGFLCA